MRRLGRLDDAGEHAGRALALARKLDMPHVVAEALDETALLCAADDPGRGEDLHHEALRVRVERGLRTFLVDSLDGLAHIAATQQRHAEAVRLLAASDEARLNSGYPRPPVNRPRHDATICALRAALGDDAFTDAQAEGTGLDLDDAVAYVSRSRGTRQRPSIGWPSLTPTEREVVGLVVVGLKNPEIASRLFVSRATVKTHLSHIYAKLAISNRTELALLATRQQAFEQ